MATNTYQNYTNTISDEYYKVSFVTTHSESIPKKMKQTGALIIMDNVDTYRKSLWFRGQLIASGYGFVNQQEANMATYFVTNLNELFGGPNGVYNFLPGYVGPDGTEGKNVWDRFQELWNSYNQTYSYFHEWLTSNSTEIINNWSYTYNSYAYLLEYILNSYNSLLTYTTSSYAYAWDTSKNLWTYFSQAYSYTWGGMDRINSYLLDYVQNCYQRCYDTDIVIYESTYSYIGEMSDLLHKYVDKVIEKLVGGAPEYLDTLGEITYLLQMVNEHGFSMWGVLNDIRNNYVTHYEPQYNGYAYIDTYTYTVMPQEHTGFTYSETGPEGDDDMQWWIEQDFGSEQYWFKASYTYYTYEMVPNAFLAINSDQISCQDPFGRYQLTYLLTKILPPYPYDIPTIELDPYQEYDFNNEIKEYGTSEVLDNIIVLYNAKDASGETEIVYDNYDEGEIVTKVTNPNNNLYYYTNSKSHYYSKDRQMQMSIGTQVYTSYPYKTLNSIKLFYKESYVRIYPELKDILFIDDVEHVIPDGNYSKDIFKNVRIPIRYRMWWWYESSGNEVNDNEIILNSPYHYSTLITNTTMKTAVYGPNSNVTTIYIGVPTNLINNLIGIKIENFDTGICREIYKKPILTDLFSISSFEYTLTTEANVDIEYTIIKYQSNKWTIDDQFRILVEFDKLF